MAPPWKSFLPCQDCRSAHRCPGSGAEGAGGCDWREWILERFLLLHFLKIGQRVRVHLTWIRRKTWWKDLEGTRELICSLKICQNAVDRFLVRAQGQLAIRIRVAHKQGFKKNSWCLERWLRGQSASCINVRACVWTPSTTVKSQAWWHQTELGGSWVFTGSPASLKGQAAHSPRALSLKAKSQQNK